MRLGMPRDFDELVRFHGPVISTVAPKDVLQVAHILWYRGILETFHPPREVTRDQVVQYLGLPPAVWYRTAQRHSSILPKPLEGKHRSAKSKYLFSDAERCYAQRNVSFPRLRQLGFFRAVVPGFKEFLLAETEKVVQELGLGPIFDLPLDLPQNDQEMWGLYANSVARVVRYHLKFGMDVDDAINEVWIKLFNSKLLVKFMRYGPKRLPISLTTDEALDYLGVSWFAWRHMMALYKGAPNPVKGSFDSLDAVYRSEDIRALDESGYFKKRGLRFLPPICVSRLHFDKYVTCSAEHALMNLFRTLDRRFNREDTLQEGACIQDNRRVRVVRRDDFDVAWEDTLASTGIAADILVDIKRRAELLEQQTA